MPFDTIELEHSVIGAVCVEQAVIRRLSPILRAEDFTVSACAAVYEAAQDADAAGRLFDGFIAAEALAGKIDDPRRFIAECIEVCPTTANAEAEAEVIHRHAERARLTATIMELLGSDPSAQRDLAAEIAAACAEQINARPATRLRPLSAVLLGTYNAMFQPDTARIDTGYGRLDALLMGMHAEELVIIGARPAVGKTAFALSIAEHAARGGKAVQVYSMEMSSTQLGERFLARGTDAAQMDHIIRRSAASDQAIADDLARALVRQSGLPIFIDDSPRTTVSRIRAQAFAARGLGLVIVDYAGLVEPERRGGGRRGTENRNQELGAVSRGLKMLAKELKIPVVLLAQLNRQKGETAQPTLADLRDSGELEQDADKVLFLWRIEEEDQTVGVSVAKTRRGRKGIVKMRFESARMRFVELEERYEHPRKRRRGGGFHDEEDG